MGHGPIRYVVVYVYRGSLDVSSMREGGRLLNTVEWWTTLFCVE